MAKLKLGAGMEVPALSSLETGYELRDHQNLTANVGLDQLIPLLNGFCTMQKSPVFFILELPATEQEEQTLRSKPADPFHKNIYYLDNCTVPVAKAILKRYGELLINDGLACFGFGNHKTEDEIFISKYNVTSIYSKELQRYLPLLEHLSIPQKEKLRTVWDTFTQEAPGTACTVEVNGETMGTVLENLAELGLYLAKQAED